MVDNNMEIFGANFTSSEFIACVGILSVLAIGALTDGDSTSMFIIACAAIIIFIVHEYFIKDQEVQSAKPIEQSMTMVLELFDPDLEINQEKLNSFYLEKIQTLLSKEESK